jgi:hypothetical protein
MATDKSGPNPFLELWTRGYRRLVPIVPPGAPISEHSMLARRPESCGKVPGERGQDGLWRSLPDWQKRLTSKDDCLAWHEMGAGVGIRTGEQDDGTWLVGIDVDTLDGRYAAVIHGLIQRRFGLLPMRQGRAPKSLYVVRVAGRVPYSRVSFAVEDHNDHVEMLSTGKQFVAYGVHPITNKPYKWVQALVPLDELKVWPVEALL